MVNDLLSQEEIDALLKGSSVEKKADSAWQDMGLLSEVASVFSAAGERVIGMLSGKTVAVKLAEETVLSQDDFLSRLGDPSPFLYFMTWEGLEIPAALVLNGRGALMLADLMMGGDGKDLPPEMNDLYLSAAQEGLSQFVGTALADLSRLLSGKKSGAQRRLRDAAARRVASLWRDGSGGKNLGSTVQRGDPRYRLF